MKKALITGITGQDGSYLAELLLDKGYEVHGVTRKSSCSNTCRIEHLINNNEHFYLHYGDLTDSSSTVKLLYDVTPDEIYNLGAQSHVKVSFDIPEYTANVNALGTLRILEGIKTLNLINKTKFYQASTSELYGGSFNSETQDETTPFAPQSPYACSKLFAYWTVVNYRNAYNMFASNGILFNHESARRGEDFVTKKITSAAAKIKFGLKDKLYLGNLDAKRDWGHAKDYVVGMYKILQYAKPDDFVLATGVTTTVREFCIKTFEKAGIGLKFEGCGIDEKGIDINTGKVIIEVHPEFFRPTEVEALIGDSSKAKKLFNWTPKFSLDDVIDEMLAEDMSLAKLDAFIKERHE